MIYIEVCENISITLVERKPTPRGVFLFTMFPDQEPRVRGPSSKHLLQILRGRGGGLGSRPKKMYGERLEDGVEYHLMSPTPRR